MSEKDKKNIEAEDSEEYIPFNYKDQSSESPVESDRDQKKKVEAIKGQGERILNFEFEEEFAPILKIYAKNDQILAFDIKDKITLGSDQEKSKIVIEHPEIAPLHCVFGVKGKDVLIKHNSAHDIIVKGKKFEAGKTYKVPFKTKIKLADLLFVEVLATRPLGLDVVKINRDWKLDLQDNAEDFRANSGKLAQRKIKEDKKNQSIFKKVLTFLFDPRDEKDIEEELNDEDNDWVTEEEWSKAPPEDRKNKVVLKAGEIVERNFKSIEKQNISSKNFFLRPIFSFFHNLKDEFSIFENKSQKDLKNQLAYSKKKLAMLQIMHLTKKEILNKENAQKLNMVGVKSLVEVSNLPTKKLANILNVKESEAEAIKNKITESIQKGAVEKSDKSMTTLEKKIVSNELKVKGKLQHLQMAGPLKRVFGSLVSYASIYLVFYYLVERQEVRPFLESILGLFKNAIPVEVTSSWKEVFTAYHFGLLYIVLHLILQLFYHLLFGTTLGQYLLGLKGQRGIIASRILGMLRYIIGLFLFPLIIFDLPMLFRLKTFKEFLTFNTLLRRESRSMMGELFGIILTVALTTTAVYTLFFDRPWQRVPHVKFPDVEMSSIKKGIF